MDQLHKPDDDQAEMDPEATPNSVTREAIEASEKGKDTFGPYESIEDLMDALQEKSDEQDLISLAQKREVDLRAGRSKTHTLEEVIEANGLQYSL